MIIVTGGAGFIGSAFIAHLNAQGIKDIIVVDNLGSSEKWKNLSNKQFLQYQHKDDFLSWIKVRKNLRGVSSIIHLGACSTTTQRDVDYLYRNNVNYTKTLAEVALEREIRFIYASSAATYGDGAQGYLDDESVIEKLQPLNPYGFSKQVFDLHAKNQKWLKKICGLKFFNVYGPNEYHKTGQHSVVLSAYRQVKNTGSVKLFKSYRDGIAHGEQQRDFVYVKDLCAIMHWLLSKPKVNGIFNIGSGKARSFNDLAKATFASLRKAENIEYVEMPAALQNQYQYFTEASMQKLIKAGYKGQLTSLENGVKDYITKYLEANEAVW